MMIKNILSTAISKYSPSLFFKLAYFHNRHKFPNLTDPRDLSEIWIKKVLNGDNLKDFFLADKYEVRKYVTDMGFGDILVPLIGVWDNVTDIDFSTFPDKFAIKMNYGAGMNIIVTDRKEIDLCSIKSQLNTWLTQKVNYSNAERHYNLIKRRIIAEEFIDDGTGGFPRDYKFMCIHGKVHCILAVSGRENGHGEYLPYTKEWEPLFEYSKDSFPQLIPPPQNLNNMIEVAEILAKKFDLVRIDLYSNGRRIWFGEITLTPAGCIFHRWTQDALNNMGKIYLNI